MSISQRIHGVLVIALVAFGIGAGIWSFNSGVIDFALAVCFFPLGFSGFLPLPYNINALLLWGWTFYGASAFILLVAKNLKFWRIAAVFLVVVLCGNLYGCSRILSYESSGREESTTKPDL